MKQEKEVPKNGKKKNQIFYKNRCKKTLLSEETGEGIFLCLFFLMMKDRRCSLKIS